MRKFVVLLSVFTLFLAVLTVVQAQPLNFRTHLSGNEEVPPVDTDGQGQAIFQVAPNRNQIDYKLIVANIEDVFASHIHCAPEGENGPVGVTLFSGSPTTINGILAQGPIIAPDTENGCEWADLSDVINAIINGNAYVNVHTTENPAGEIRGQIEGRVPSGRQ